MSDKKIAKVNQLEIILIQKSILNFLIKNDATLKENELICKTIEILDDLYKKSFEELIEEKYESFFTQLKTRVLNDE